jgi:hypothetical protein
MELADLSDVPAQLDGVSERRRAGRDGNADAIEDAVIGAWELQSGR